MKLKQTHKNKKGVTHQGELIKCKVCFKENFVGPDGTTSAPMVVGYKNGGKW